MAGRDIKRNSVIQNTEVWQICFAEPLFYLIIPLRIGGVCPAGQHSGYFAAEQTVKRL